MVFESYNISRGVIHYRTAREGALCTSVEIYTFTAAVAVPKYFRICGPVAAQNHNSLYVILIYK